MYISIGIIVCFSLFLLFDVNDVYWKKRAGRHLFTVGMVGVIFISTIVCGDAVLTLGVENLRFWLLLVAAGVCLILLIYSLYFAIPSDEAYGKNTITMEGRIACTEGMYALSRHPSVLWMACIYAFLYLALPTERMLLLFLATTICNVLYVMIQDIWTFPNLFQNYEDYKKETPFLLPNPRSLKRCITTWKR